MEIQETTETPEVPEIIASEGGVREQLAQLVRHMEVIGTEVKALASRVEAMDRRRKQR